MDNKKIILHLLVLLSITKITYGFKDVDYEFEYPTGHLHHQPSYDMNQSIKFTFINDMYKIICRHILLDQFKRSKLYKLKAKANVSKRGLSVLTRLKIFSILSGDRPYYSPYRVFRERHDRNFPIVYLKNDIISAKTRAYLRPLGAPLRFG